MTLGPVELAYIDPGAGSLLVQVIIGTILAVPYFLRGQVARGYRALRRRMPSHEPDPQVGPR